MDAETERDCNDESDIDFDYLELGDNGGPHAGFDFEIEIDDADADVQDEQTNSHSMPTAKGKHDGSVPEEEIDFEIENFTPGPGCQHDLTEDACILNYFFLMFPQALLETIVDETNRYATQITCVTPCSAWYPTTLAEIRAFIAINIMFGINDKPQLWCYWSRDTRFKDPWISSVMPIGRFALLNRFLHCRDTSQKPQRGEPGFDPLYKIRNIVTTTLACFKSHYRISEREISDDECVGELKGHLSFVKYMPVTFDANGSVKVWTMCELGSGYCLSFDILAGKSNGDKNTNNTLGKDVVDKLSSLPCNGNAVVVDNDQPLSYKVGRNCRTWWRFLLWHIINLSINNAYIIWKRGMHSYDVKGSYNQLRFRADVAEELRNGFSCRKMSVQQPTCHQPIHVASINQHVLEKLKTRKKKCVNCSLNGRRTSSGRVPESSWKCRFCDVALCRNVCFGQYHEVGLAISKNLY